MKVIITGTNGLLGGEIWRTFERDHDLIAIGRTQPAFVPPAQWREVDLTNAAMTYGNITKENPDLVVHCAAYNDVDGAERSPEAAFQGNALATRHVALACQRFDSVLMHISTDYVFDGAKPPADGYREFDPVHPLGRYAESKVWAEQSVRDLLNRYFVVRTSWLFGPGRPTWVDSVAHSAKENKVVQAVSDMVSSPTYTLDLAAALLSLAQSQLFGVYHLSNAGYCARPALAEEVLRLCNRSGYSKLQALPQSELKLPARRPAFSGLQNLLWKLNGFKPLRPWQSALAEHFSKAKVSL